MTQIFPATIQHLFKSVDLWVWWSWGSGGMGRKKNREVKGKSLVSKLSSFLHRWQMYIFDHCSVSAGQRMFLSFSLQGEAWWKVHASCPLLLVPLPLRPTPALPLFSTHSLLYITWWLPACPWSPAPQRLGLGWSPFISEQWKGRQWNELGFQP